MTAAVLFLLAALGLGALVAVLASRSPGVGTEPWPDETDRLPRLRAALTDKEHHS